MRRRAVADDLSDVSEAVAWAARQVAEADLAEDLRYNLEVCLEEALANLVEHARPAEDAKDIDVAIAADRDGATVVVTDHCVPFDSAHAPQPAAPAVGALQIGGRGLRLMSALSSELAYRSCNGANELTMRFRSPA